MPRKPIDKEVFEILSKTKPIKADRESTFRTALVVIAVLVVAGSAWAAYAHLNAPRGAFTIPIRGSTTERLVELEGYTQNIPPDRKYLWVTVDVPGLVLCWPHRPIYKTNSPFKTKFLEQGPNQKFTVSLYAVDLPHHQEILNWFAECRTTNNHAGLSLLPEDFKLYSVDLLLADKQTSGYRSGRFRPPF